MAIEEQPEKAFKSAKAFEAWLAKQHAKSGGIWLKFAKKGSGIASVAYVEAVEVALCYGWIDGQVRSLDAEFYVQRFTPRRARSPWSKINCARAAQLVEAGRMQAPGLSEMDRAKADGRWEAAYASPRAMVAPDDFLQAVKSARMGKRWEALDGRNRYAMLYQIHDAKRPETRARRIAKFVEMLRQGETLY